MLSILGQVTISSQNIPHTTCDAPSEASRHVTMVMLPWGFPYLHGKNNTLSREWVIRCACMYMYMCVCVWSEAIPPNMAVYMYM